MAAIATASKAAGPVRAALSRPMVVAAVGAVAIGLLTRRRELVRAGARMGAAQLATVAADVAVRRFEGAEGHGLASSPKVVGAVATWLAESAVTAIFERLDNGAGAASARHGKAAATAR